MNLIEQLGKKGEQAWQQFCKKYELTDKQQEQFARYLSLLRTWNENINLTAITEPATIITHHFQDSLELGTYFDIADMHHIIDIGSGAGLPGIPLKIKYPELKVTLIEVTGKKIAFLRMVIQELGLEDIELYTLDWRTFLRKTNEDVDLFVSRASLAPAELVRMFKPSSPYKETKLVYFASREWQPEAEELPFLQKEFEYQISSKKRRFVLFGAPSSEKKIAE